MKKSSKVKKKKPYPIRKIKISGIKSDDYSKHG